MDERLLVKRAKRGDTAAFAELYGTIYKRLYQFALYTLGNTQDAEDVVSAAVRKHLKISGNCGRKMLFPPGCIVSWQICVNRKAGILSTGRRTDGRKRWLGRLCMG